jgi:hypothetical protein
MTLGDNNLGCLMAFCFGWIPCVRRWILKKK